MTEPWRQTRRAPSDLIYEIVEALVDGQPMSKTHLMSRLRLNWPFTTRCISKMERLGFVTVETRHAGQHLRHRITITQDGVRLFKEMGMLRRLRDD